MTQSELFPPRTQADRILDFLATGETLTAIDALNKFGCFRLAARIKDLKRDGHRICADTISANGKRYAAYRLQR